MSFPHRRFTTVVALLLAGGLFLFGCDTTSSQPERQVVVEAYLKAGATLPDIRLTRSVDIDQPYDPGRAAVFNATVRIDELGPEGAAARSVNFEGTLPGVYRPTALLEVQPQTRYRLSVTTEDGHRITATTTVPDTIGIVGVQNEETVYQSANQPTFTITPPEGTGAGPTALVLTTTSLLDFQAQPEPALRAQLTPLYADGYDPETDSIATLRETSSGLLNRDNFDRTSAGNIRARLPWLAVAFFGPNEVGAHVLDDNLYDLIRTQQTQQGGPGAGLGPGEIPNVVEHVNGGTGIFGSYASDTKRITVQPPGGGGS